MKPGINQVRRVMKGQAVTDYSQITWPKLGSPKVDGFRCVVSDIARTTSMKEFPNRYVHEAFKGLLPKTVLLDGELVVGKRRGNGVLQRTSSGVTSASGQPDWRLWVFDAPRANLKYEERLRLAKSHVEALNHPQVRYLKHRMLHNLEEFMEFLAWCLKQGFEGVMLHDPDAQYKEGKSTIKQQICLKVKPFEDHEARITDFFEEMENTNEAKKDATGKSKRSSAKDGKRPKGTLGGFIGLDVVTGVEVRVGGGFTKKQRAEFWKRRKELVGALFTYGKQLVGEKDKPRHPTFRHLRPDWDMD